MSVYDEIREEREEQDAQWGGAEHDDEHTRIDWIRFIAEHLGKALGGRVEVIDEVHWFTATISGSVGAMSEFRRQMIRVAALAVAAVESLDRRVSKRCGYQ